MRENPRPNNLNCSVSVRRPCEDPRTQQIETRPDLTCPCPAMQAKAACPCTELGSGFGGGGGENMRRNEHAAGAAVDAVDTSIAVSE